MTPLNFSGQSDLTAAVSLSGSWAAYTDFVVSGLEVTSGYIDDLFRVGKYVGETNVPQEIRKLRRSTSELMRRMGQPVIVKHMWNDSDVTKGLADKSENFQDIYGQVRNRDPMSYGTGFQSREKSTNEWIAPDGTIVISDTSPGADFKQAARYRGFGPGFLTYIIEPDAAVDAYQTGPEGVLIDIQTAMAIAAWYPEINDNDLIINVTLDSAGRVTGSRERYSAKMTSPVSIRGTQRLGRSEYSADRGNAHVINQTFEMVRIPENNILYSVEIDR